MDQLTHELENQGKSDMYRPFIKGGMWRNFFTKYPESNWMQKRVQFLSTNLGQLESKGGVPQSLKDDLYRAQCNCAFWHGVFGGLYLPHLRHAIYEHLLKAEAAFLKLGGVLPGLVDIDSDGVREYRLRSESIQVFLTENHGHIREIDWLPANFNVTNYMQRYSESYHDKLAQASSEKSNGGSIHDSVLTKEEGLADKLFVDSYRRHSLIDHFFGPQQTLDAYYRGSLIEDSLLRDIKVLQSEAGVAIHCNASVNDTEVTIQKRLELHNNELAIKLSIKNVGEAKLRSNYGLEFNFGLLGGNSHDRYFLLDGKHGGSLNANKADQNINTLSLVDEWDNFKIKLQFSSTCALWRAPIETISMSEAGFERVYQASSILPHWQLNLDPGASFELDILLDIDQYKS